MKLPSKMLPLRIFCLFALILFSGSPAWSVDISGILPATLDQPNINCYVSLSPNGDPLSNPDGDPEFGIPFFNIEAYFDTGASGILFSQETAAYLGIPQSYVGSQPVIYEDVGVGGSEQFYVSQPVYLSLAGNPGADLDNPLTYQTSYNHSFGPVRTQINMNPSDLFPLDVVGIPAMAGKVVVMQPGSWASIFSLGPQTYVYNPGTPFHPTTPDTDPGIPTTGHHIKLSYAPFDSFTQVTPSGAAGPTLAQNPFIGPNPVAALYGEPVDNTPGVTVSLNGLSATGSFLFDTGAAASMISTSLAASLHIRYVNDSPSTGVLEFFDPLRPEWSAPVPNQFTLELGGIGGTASAAGFYLDNMLLRTLDGNPSDDLDPNHLNFRGVPVLVADITVQNPITLQSLTLDGIFGMNNLFTSLTTDLSDMADSNFNWIVFDQPNGILGLDVKAPAASWSGASFPADAKWSNKDNWGGRAPAAGFALSFGDTTVTRVTNNNDFAAGTQFAGITFDGTQTFNLQGNRIALTGDVVNFSTKTQTISLDLTLTDASRSFVTDSADIVIAGHIDGSQDLIKTGPEKLILTSSNTYTGNTIISEGMLVLNGADLADTSSISIAPLATLEILSGTPTLGPITGQGAVIVAGSSTVLTTPSITADSLTITSVAPPPVPEPSMLVLFSAWIASMLLIRNKRRTDF